jgi:SAM-dependent methyltransferase
MTTSMQQKWDDLHRDVRFMPVYPNDKVVAWVFRNFPRERARDYALLDLGCGAGRHALFMAKEGYRVTACDFSCAGLHETQRRAAQSGVTITTICCEADSLDLRGDRDLFDGVVCYGVLNYLPHARFLRAIGEIRRVLKPGGKAFVVTRSTDDSRCDAARKLGPCTYEVPVLGAGAASRVEEGMQMTFVGRDEVRSAFAAFEQLVIDRSSITSGGGSFTDDDWHIFAVK